MLATGRIVDEFIAKCPEDASRARDVSGTLTVLCGIYHNQKLFNTIDRFKLDWIENLNVKCPIHTIYFPDIYLFGTFDYQRYFAFITDISTKFTPFLISLICGDVIKSVFVTNADHFQKINKWINATVYHNSSVVHCRSIPICESAYKHLHQYVFDNICKRFY